MSRMSISWIILVWFGLVWFGLFVRPFIHISNIGHVNYRLQFIYYNTTYKIWTSTQYNIINNNTTFKDQLEVESVSTSRNMCLYKYT
jgi:hypothetical protein